MNEIQKRIQKLWEKGYTATEVGKDLGMTRNAVMGQLYRMRMAGVKLRGAPKRKEKVAPPPKPIGMKKAVRKAPAPIKPTVAEIKERSNPQPTGKPVPLMQLKPLSCRYIVSGWLPKEYMFCNEVQKEGSSYCLYHHYKCYVPKSSIRDLRAKPNDAPAKSSDPS